MARGGTRYKQKKDLNKAVLKSIMKEVAEEMGEPAYVVEEVWQAQFRDVRNTLEVYQDKDGFYDESESMNTYKIPFIGKIIPLEGWREFYNKKNAIRLEDNELLNSIKDDRI